MNTEVNIPLLRKAVEWAEAEAAKPPELCEWEQGHWRLTPDERARFLAEESNPADTALLKAPECGTCYCIAGFVASSSGSQFFGFDSESIARDLLGIGFGGANQLFDASNSIEDVRRIAEDLAGERL